MQGSEFYEFLRVNYTTQNKVLYGNFTFHDWLYKKDTNSFSFRFKIANKYVKAIPKEIIISAWDSTIKITDEWLYDNFNYAFHKDCRLSVLNFLLERYNYLRSNV